MKNYVEITDVVARQILDSRGNPTVEVEVVVEGSDSRVSYVAKTKKVRILIKK